MGTVHGGLPDVLGEKLKARQRAMLHLALSFHTCGRWYAKAA
jgi:hypothetical protein